MKKLVMIIYGTEEYFEKSNIDIDHQVNQCKVMNCDEKEKKLGFIKAECYVEDVTE